MKKTIILCILLTGVITGCSLKNINNENYEDIVKNAIATSGPKYNTVVSGYKFYLPRDMKVYDEDSTNTVLYSGGKKYYLYVDLISYYNKVNNDYDIESIVDNVIYSNKIKDASDQPVGYVIISTMGEKKYLQVMYNYGKVELITTLDNIRNEIYNSLTILNSITYNDVIIEGLVGNTSHVEEESSYDLLGPANGSSSTILDWLKDYEDVDNELPDDNELDIGE